MDSLPRNASTPTTTVDPIVALGDDEDYGVIQDDDYGDAGWVDIRDGD